LHHFLLRIAQLFLNLKQQTSLYCEITVTNLHNHNF
jgi:hypothetical protein